MEKNMTTATCTISDNRTSAAEGNDTKSSSMGLFRRVSSSLLRSSSSNPHESKSNNEENTTGNTTPTSSIRRSSSILSFLGGYWNEEEDDNTKKTTNTAPLFLLKDTSNDQHEGKGEEEKETEVLRNILCEHMDKLSDDAIIKICRQLEFWYSHGVKAKLLSMENFINLCHNLCDQSTRYTDQLTLTATTTPPSPVVPKVRFGKTNISMPIITCGGMRFQHTWLPDMIPILSESKKSVLSKSPSQENIKNVVRACLQLGINHFETARFYGTSEYQLVQALVDLMESGEVRRDEFILQTKIVPQATVQDFQKAWGQSWNHIGPKLQYIDLFTIHGLSTQDYDIIYNEALKLKEEGKLRHIGFSTHGTSEQIMKLINTKKFEFINIHYHFFGSYHGEGTPDTLGGHGNLACVKRAQELDMGIFCISPFDKGGKLYRPSKQMLVTLGHELTPIAFASLHVWETAKMHTISVGFARPSDLDEVLEAARLFAGKSTTSTTEGNNGTNSRVLLKSAEDRLRSRMEEICGREWAEKGMLNLPTCYDECTQGIAIGHILWLHNLLVCYGMYDFCKDRYKMLEANKWNPKKSFSEQVKKWPAFNGGRAYDDSVDLTEALSKHYNSTLVVEKLKECHSWLSSSNPAYTDEELEAKGWTRGYNLTVWEEFPGESITPRKVLLQAATRGRAGITGTGPTAKAANEASSLRSSIKKI